MNIWYARVLALLTLFSFANIACAQQDPLFLGLVTNDKSPVEWNREYRAWVATSHATDFVFAAQHLVVSDRFFSAGKPIRILADTLDMKDSALISSGYPSSAAKGRGAGAPGDQGGKAGNIAVVVRNVIALNLSANGQNGGDGEAGFSRSGMAKAGIRPSENGGNASCSGKTGRNGRDGTIPSEDGDDGLPGGTGGSAKALPRSKRKGFPDWLKSTGMSATGSEKSK
jgi:hypothetical protein